MDGPGTPLLPPAAYVNFLRVTHRQAEFFLAFGQVPQDGTAQVHLLSSVIASPVHAKAMLQTLAEAIEGYERRFGTIPAVEPAAVRPVEAIPFARRENASNRS